jgi:creatinine amidohydrolase
MMVQYVASVLGMVACCLWASTAFAQAPGAYLGELTWTDAEIRLKESPVVVVPFGGGAKEHGPHLPMNADQKVMEYLCQQAVDSVDVIVAPPILHGWFPAFRGYPGTEVADPHVFEQYVFEVAMSLVQQGAQRIVLLNTGIAMATGLPLSIAAREIRTQTGAPVLVVSWDDLETPEIDELSTESAGGHAGDLETSINLFLQPELVHMDRAVVDYGNREQEYYPGYEPGRLARDPADPGYTETGLFGDPTLASAEKGRKALEIMTRQWLLALRGFSTAATAR